MNFEVDFRGRRDGSGYNTRKDWDNHDTKYNPQNTKEASK